MNKSDLVEAIASNVDSTKAEAGRFLDAFVAQITDALKQGGQVTLPGFGTFAVGFRAARTGRNPKTGEPIQIRAARIAKFKAGKALKEAMEVEA